MADESPVPTAEEFDERWVPPALLVERLSPLVNSGQTAVSEIMQRLIGGTLDAVAGSANFVQDGETVNPTLSRIPAGFWQTVDYVRPSHADFWRTGTLIVDRVQTRYGPAPTTILFFDVRFDPEGIEKIAAVRAASLRAAGAAVASGATATPELKTHAGGAPRKDYWEPLLIEIARQLFEGELIPKKQAEIETAMHEWLAGQDITPGEWSIRQRAKLFKWAIQPKG